MKTKTLLIAAAALAAGVMSSQAQVYSQNVVGYVNVPGAASQYNLLCNPLTTGNDVITNVLKGVPANSVVLKWNGNGWDGYTYSAKKAAWLDGSGNTNNNLTLPPGVGFFYSPGANVTNTFIGSVAALSGQSVTNSLQVGYYPVGSIVPFADVVTNTATVNLTVPANTILETWDSGSQSFTAVTYSAKKGVWLNGSGQTNNPSISVGQGFFVNPPTAANWVQVSP